MKPMAEYLRRFPFTLCMLLGLIVAAMVTNTHFAQITDQWLDRTGFAPADLVFFRFERLFTSALVTVGGTVFWEALVMVIFCVGIAEWMVGWKRTALTFWGVHLLALLLLSLIVYLSLDQLQALGMESSELVRDVGPSAGYFACLGLVSSRLKRPWNWASGAILLAIFVVVLFMPAASGEDAGLKLSADLAHLLAVPLGWLSSLVKMQKVQNM
jgi:hypothetical protein